MLENLALLVEFSEARAYTSLIGAASPSHLQDHGFRAVNIGSAVAIVAESVTNTLNLNRVIGLGVAEAATESMVDQIVDLYASRGLSFGVEIGPSARPTALAKWLLKRGIRRGLPTAIHYRQAGAVATRDGSLSVVRADASQHRIVADICCSVFRMPSAAHALIAGTGNLQEWRQWLAYSRDQPIAAALSFVRDGVGWLGWDATLPEFRGRGAHSALIVHRLNDAFHAGCTYVTTETGVGTAQTADPSYRNYERLGFSFAYERVTYGALHNTDSTRG